MFFVFSFFWDSCSYWKLSRLDTFMQCTWDTCIREEKIYKKKNQKKKFIISKLFLNYQIVVFIKDLKINDKKLYNIYY